MGKRSWRRLWLTITGRGEGELQPGKVQVLDLEAS